MGRNALWFDFSALLTLTLLFINRKKTQLVKKNETNRCIFFLPFSLSGQTKLRQVIKCFRLCRTKFLALLSRWVVLHGLGSLQVLVWTGSGNRTRTLLISPNKRSGLATRIVETLVIEKAYQQQKTEVLLDQHHIRLDSLIQINNSNERQQRPVPARPPRLFATKN